MFTIAILRDIMVIVETQVEFLVKIYAFRCPEPKQKV